MRYIHKAALPCLAYSLYVILSYLELFTLHFLLIQITLFILSILLVLFILYTL